MRQLPVHDGGASCRLDEQGAARRNIEFADVVRRGLRHRDRTGDGDVLLTFRRGGGLENDVRELAERESACCRFFIFDIRVEDDHIVVRVAAPDDKTDYLDALYQATDPAGHPRARADERPLQLTQA